MKSLRKSLARASRKSGEKKISSSLRGEISCKKKNIEKNSLSLFFYLSFELPSIPDLPSATSLISHKTLSNQRVASVEQNGLTVETGSPVLAFFPNFRDKRAGLKIRRRVSASTAATLAVNGNGRRNFKRGRKGERERETLLPFRRRLMYTDFAVKVGLRYPVSEALGIPPIRAFSCRDRLPPRDTSDCAKIIGQDQGGKWSRRIHPLVFLPLPLFSNLVLPNDEETKR